MATVLITGSAGFMGSHLAEAMLSAGHRVVGLDNFDPYYDRQIKMRNSAALLQSDAFTLIEGDIRDAEVVNRLFADAGPDWVLHWAAKAGVRPSLQVPAEYAAVNVEGTTNILEAARSHMPVKVIFASSSSVYGVDNPLPFREDADVSRPISPYAATKVASEALCHTFHHLYNLPVMCLRLFTVYGPRQRPDLAINKFVRLMSEGQPIPLYGDGSTTRDYTYIDDVLAAVMRAVELGFEFEIVNIGSNRPVSLTDLVAALEQAMGVEAGIEHLPQQAGDVPHTLADINRAKQLLDWEPKVSLQEGLSNFLDWTAKQSNSSVGEGAR